VERPAGVDDAHSGSGERADRVAWADVSARTGKIRVVARAVERDFDITCIGAVTSAKPERTADGCR
jgi:hypothetical protein